MPQLKFLKQARQAPYRLQHSALGLAAAHARGVPQLTAWHSCTVWA
jgi:hypothetical protein